MPFILKHYKDFTSRASMSNIKCLSLLVSGFKRRMNKMGDSETRIPATATLSTLATIMLSIMVTMMNQGHKIIDLGVNWKGFINWVSIPHMNFLYLTVQNLWPRLKFFGNRQTDTHRQKGTQTDRAKLDFHELHLSEIEGGGGYESIPLEKFLWNRCQIVLFWTNLD